MLMTVVFALVSGVPAQAVGNAKIDLRFGPGTQYGITGSITDGRLVTIVCTTSSEPVAGSSIWDKLGNGSWVPDALVHSGTGKPECGPTGLRPTGDDYPYRGKSGIIDRWSMYSGQCTSWVAWRMEQLNGYFHNNGWRNGIQGHWGNAHEWNDNAVRLGYRVDRTPRTGAIAQWERNAGGASGRGHVAYISAVNGTTVTVQEYNWDSPRGFGTRSVPLSQISNVIHFAE
jgi:surface antigen